MADRSILLHDRFRRPACYVKETKKETAEEPARQILATGSARKVPVGMEASWAPDDVHTVCLSGGHFWLHP